MEVGRDKGKREKIGRALRVKKLEKKIRGGQIIGHALNNWERLEIRRKESTGY